MVSVDSRKSLTYLKTRNAVMWSSLLSEPLTALYAFLPFILYQELEASAFQVAIFFMLKPVVSLFSMYWSMEVASRPDRLVANVVWGGILARLPFFLFPWMNNSWLILLSGAAYWMFYRGVVPAWMEILKMNLPSKQRSRVFSLGAIFGYLQGVFLAILMGPWMDHNSEAWRWLYPIAALMGMIGVGFQARIPLDIKAMVSSGRNESKQPFKQRLVEPWKKAFQLLGEHKDFARYQWGIMICGLAIMIMKPAEPVIIEKIGLSYTDLAVAILVCKGLGYVVTSALWARWLDRLNIFTFTSLVFFIVGVSYLFLLSGTLITFSVFICYFVYGIFLAGNHLSWNLSGTIFCTEGDSSSFTSVSVAMVGLRGLVGPFMGSTLLVFFGPFSVVTLGVSLCVVSGLRMMRWGVSSKVRKASPNLLSFKKSLQ